MARRLFGAKPLSKPMIDVWQLDPCEQIPVTYQSENNIYIKKSRMKKSSVKGRPFRIGFNVSTQNKLANTSSPIRHYQTKTH